MIGRSSSFLGIAVGDRAVTCAEVFVAGAKRTVRRTATFTFPDGATLDQPEAIGAALATFLRQKRFTASRVVVGVPARWLIAVEKELPPSDEDQARAVLRLQAERLGVAEQDAMVFDFAGKADARNASKVLLVGMHRDRLDRVNRMMDAAGMSVVAVTSTGLTLSTTTSRIANSSGMLMLARGGGEMVWRHADSPRMLRHVPFAINGHDLPPLAPLSAELHRAVMLGTGSALNGDGATRELLLLDAVGLDANQVSQLSQRLGVPVRGEDPLTALRADADAGAITEGDDSGKPLAAFAPAMSLAIAGADDDLLPLDFRRSRLAVAPPAKISQRMMMGIAIGAGVVIGLVSLFFIVQSRQSTLDALNKQLAGLKDQMTDAQSSVDRLNYGRGFFETRPPVLDCLKAMTGAFRDDDRIWATSFTLRDNGKGQLVGKAADRDTVLRIRDRLARTGHFSDVKVLDMREADARTHEVSFSASFTYVGVE